MRQATKLMLLSLMVAVAAIDLSAQQQPETKAPAAKPADAMPTIDQVLDKYVQAIGGKAALTKLTSRYSQGTIEIPAFGASGSFELYAKAPDKWLSHSDFAGYGVVEQGFGNSIAWAKDPERGVREITGAELAQMKRTADFYSSLKMKEMYPKMTLKGKKEKVGEGEAYVIEAALPEGGSEKMYFDAKTGLLLRSDQEREGPNGRIPVTFQFENYKEVDGVQIAFVFRQTSPEISFTITLSEVKHNVPIDDAMFNKPSAS